MDNSVRPRVSDDTAYILPMAVFLALTAIGSRWPALMPAGYIVKTLLAGALLIALRRHYSRISWNFWWLGILIGIVGVVQWVGMEKAILHFWPHYPNLASRGPADAANPLNSIRSPTMRGLFLAARLAGPVLVVPFMEELFWRDYLWRTLLAPNDFKLASIGEWDWKSFAVVTLLFASVHVQWITSIVWGAMIAILLFRAKSLGACVIAHAITNLLLGVYVLWSGDWWFW
jgi:CAAX prenyl protease-like protein